MGIAAGQKYCPNHKGNINVDIYEWKWAWFWVWTVVTGILIGAIGYGLWWLVRTTPKHRCPLCNQPLPRHSPPVQGASPTS